MFLITYLNSMNTSKILNCYDPELLELTIILFKIYFILYFYQYTFRKKKIMRSSNNDFHVTEFGLK